MSEPMSQTAHVIQAIRDDERARVCDELEAALRKAELESGEWHEVRDGMKCWMVRVSAIEDAIARLRAGA